MTILIVSGAVLVLLLTLIALWYMVAMSDIEADSIWFREIRTIDVTSLFSPEARAYYAAQDDEKEAALANS